MKDNQAAQRFELEENGLLVWADYRLRDGKVVLPHVEADRPCAEPAPRGGCCNRSWITPAPRT